MRELTPLEYFQYVEGPWNENVLPELRQFQEEVESAIDAIIPGGSTGLVDPLANGILSRTSLGTVTPRTITGTSNKITVTDGDGVSGNPTITIPANAQLSIAKITNLTSNGFVKTSSSDGTLSVGFPTATEVGLGNVTNDAQVKRTEMGAALGVATLDASTKIPLSQLPDTVIGAVDYQGTWNASTNSPNLGASSPSKGDYYVVSTNGSTSLGGITDWKQGDWAIYNGTAWEKVDNTDAVTSVFGRQGIVVAVSGDYSFSLISGTAQVNQGGTGATTLASNGVLYGNGTSAIQALAVNATATNKFLGQVSSGAPAWVTIVTGDINTLTNTWANTQTFTVAPVFSAMTAGSVLFAGTSGLLSQDNSKFFYDATNHRLGLNTTSPQSSLSVFGGTTNINIGGNYGSGYNGIWLNGSVATGNYNLLSRASDGHLIINRPSGSDVIIAENDTTYAIFKSGGNVGIGTITPNRLFVIAAMSQAIFQLTDSSLGVTNANGFQIQQIGVNTSVLNYETGYLAIFTSAAERMRILSGGNIGLGNTNPQALVHIGAGTDASAAAVSPTLYVSAAGSTQVSIRDSTNDVESYWGAASGAIIFGSVTNTSIFFRVNNSNVGILNTSGNLGIGTTSPRKLTDFLSTTQAQLRLSYSDASMFADFQVNSSGNLSISPVGALVNFPTNHSVRLQSDNYVSQTTGLGLTFDTGSGDFRYLFADEIHAKAFIADLEQALAGGQIISKSVAPLAVDFTVPAASGTATLVVEEFKGFGGMRVFVNGDYVNVRQFTRTQGATVNDPGSIAVTNCWGTVTYVSTDSTNKTQTYTFTRSAAPNAGGASASTVISKGTLILDYGVSGNGYIESNAIDGVQTESGSTMSDNSPYTQIVTWATHPNSGKTLRTRTGNLKGVTGVTEYGLYAGNGDVTATSKFVRISDQNFEIHNIGLDLYEGSTKTISLNQATPYFAIGNPMPTSYLQASTSGVWMGNAGSSVYKVRVGTTNGSSVLTQGFTWDGSALNVIGSGSFSGSITATSGFIGGWAINSTSISSSHAVLDSTGEYLALGATPPTAYGFNVGVFLTGASGGKLSMYADSNNYLLWNASQLIIQAANFTLSSSGNITATGGTVGGWTLGSTTLTGGNAVLSSTGVLTLGTSTDVVILDASHATYRLAIGHTTYSSAPFRVTKAGAFTASNADVTGTITATGGSITGTLNMGGASSAIAIGNPPPTSLTSGTGIWIDRTGLYTIAAGTKYMQIGNGANHITFTPNGITGIGITWTPLTGSSATISHDGDEGILGLSAARIRLAISDAFSNDVRMELVGKNKPSGVTAEARLQIYAQSGTFGGVLIGTPNDSPNSMLDVRLQDSGTNALTNVSTIVHNTSGTPAANFGAALLFNLQSSTTVNQNAGRIGAIWTTATHASRTSAITFQTVNNAGSLTEVARFAGNGDLTITGLLKVGSGPTTLTDSTGHILSTALNTVAVAQGGTGVTTSTGSGNNVLSDTPTLKGQVVISAPTSGRGLQVTAVTGNFSAEFFGAGGAGNSNGVTIAAGGNSSDMPLRIYKESYSAFILGVYGDGSMVVGAPTGGSKGAGTINAQAVYDDNVLLTDWMFDLHFDKKQRVTPTTPVAPVKKKGQSNSEFKAEETAFKQKMEEHSIEVSRLVPTKAHHKLFSLEETFTHTFNHRRLPWMPSRDEFEKERHTGGMISRLWQGQEQQQIFLFGINSDLQSMKTIQQQQQERIKELEARVKFLEGK